MVFRAKDNILGVFVNDLPLLGGKFGNEIDGRWLDILLGQIGEKLVLIDVVDDRFSEGTGGLGEGIFAEQDGIDLVFGKNGWPGIGLGDDLNIVRHG